MRKKGRILLALLLCMVCVFGGCGKSDGNTSQTQKEENLQSGGNEEQKDISSGEETDAQEKEVYVQPEMKGEISISCFVEQEFLPQEISGTKFYQPQNNHRERELQNSLRNKWKEKYGY